MNVFIAAHDVAHKDRGRPSSELLRRRTNGCRGTERFVARDYFDLANAARARRKLAHATTHHRAGQLGVDVKKASQCLVIIPLAQARNSLILVLSAAWNRCRLPRGQ